MVMTVSPALPLGPLAYTLGCPVCTMCPLSVWKSIPQTTEENEKVLMHNRLDSKQPPRPQHRLLQLDGWWYTYKLHPQPFALP